VWTSATPHSDCGASCAPAMRARAAVIQGNLDDLWQPVAMEVVTVFAKGMNPKNMNIFWHYFALLFPLKFPLNVD